VIGVGQDGEEIVARNGRYGPYVQHGKESRSLEREEQLLTIGLEDAKAILATPKERRGGQAAAPLKEVGADPVSGKPIVVKAGRFGPYVTDGETNASLRTGDDPEEITLDRAVELLAERRAKGPAKKKAKGPAKKTAARGRSKAVLNGQLCTAGERRRIQAERGFPCARKPVGRFPRNIKAPVTFEVSRGPTVTPGSRRISLLE